MDKAVSPLISGLNVGIAAVKKTIFTILWTVPVPPIFPPIMILIILILIIVYVCCNFILDRKFYLPCWGCQEGNIVFKCMPGTGKGSISCTIYTEFLNTIKTI